MWNNINFQCIYFLATNIQGINRFLEWGTASFACLWEHARVVNWGAVFSIQIVSVYVEMGCSTTVEEVDAKVPVSVKCCRLLYAYQPMWRVSNTVQTRMQNLYLTYATWGVFKLDPPIYPHIKRFCSMYLMLAAC